MRVILQRTAILLAVFLAAIAVYFIWFQKKETPETLYTSLEEAGFPVISVDMLGREMNHLHGHSTQTEDISTRSNLTILPADRKLSIYVGQNQMQLQGISYEIRSLDRERLIERTEIAQEEWQSLEDGRVSVQLPIQNLLTEGREYRLTVVLSTEESGKLYYDTRILLTDMQMAEDMVDLALNFSDCTLDVSRSGELSTYLEPNNTADNSSLGRVSIHSSLAQVSWRNLGMQRTSPIYVELAELNGNLATIKLRYVAEQSGQEVEGEGEAETESQASYEVMEDFTLRWSSQRIYMMDYNRSVNQIFSGAEELFSGKRVQLGVTDGSSLQVMSSASKNCTAFLANRELWAYDSRDNEVFKIFTFRDNGSDELHHGFEQHKIKILRVSDDAVIDFLVYGYMNRGEHEGQCGITYYQYDSNSRILKERFFAESSQGYELLREDVDRLTYLNSKDVLYVFYQQAVYGIDLTSGEYLVIAEGLSDDSYCISGDKTILAWQDSTDLLSSHVIHVMNLETGEKREIQKGDSILLRTLGFVDNDIVYGMAREEDSSTLYGKLAEIPMYALEVADETTEVAAHYEKEGLYLTDIQVEGSRIHMLRSTKNADGSYAKRDEDTLINNEEQAAEESQGIGWYNSEEMGRLYYVALPTEIAEGKSLSYQAPRRVEKEHNSDLVLKSNGKEGVKSFYAYSGGRLLGKYTKFSDAVQTAYEHMGIVTDERQTVLWMRGNRSSARTIRSPKEVWLEFASYVENFSGNISYEDGWMLLDGRDCTLEQMLFYVDKGYPVPVGTGSGSYSLIVGYDSSSVQIYEPDSEQTNRLSMEAAEAYFESCGNNYIAPFFTNS